MVKSGHTGPEDFWLCGGKKKKETEALKPSLDTVTFRREPPLKIHPQPLFRVMLYDIPTPLTRTKLLSLSPPLFTARGGSFIGLVDIKTADGERRKSGAHSPTRPPNSPFVL